MNQLLLIAIPLLPICSALILMLVTLDRRLVTGLAISSVGLSALAVLVLQQATASDFSPLHIIWLSWFEIGNLEFNFGWYLDPLSLMMISVITGVGTLIHLFSVAFMAHDQCYQRYFCYLNLFVGAMLILVLADNLLLLYLGWEGVGLCSYLLIGFWFSDRANNRAANKAFIMTRIGDTAMLIGLIILFWQFGTLDIATINQQAATLWQTNSDIANLTTLLLFIGAAGKSAQIPLQNWLPDAMAGPTPVSALIHAATMVTAGIYLISRNSELFAVASDTMTLIAVIGTLTLLLGASAAMVQSDLKRILAYSTISQLGYMFLALGVGATAAANFHLMTHAFFKALLFLSAGAIIHCLDHQHNIFKMGGLLKRMPIIAGAFIVGCAALASLPLLSGFFSKELILAQVTTHDYPLLWVGAVLGALMTAFYSARLVLVVFFGSLQQVPTAPLPALMTGVLAALIGLSLFGGILPPSIAQLFPPLDDNLAPLHHYLPIAIPFVGIALAYWCFKRGWFGRPIDSSPLKQLHQFLLSGWHVDKLYQTVFVTPFLFITQLNKADIIDRGYRIIEALFSNTHQLASRSQTGSLRLYSAMLIIFVVLAIGWMLASGGIR